MRTTIEQWTTAQLVTAFVVCGVIAGIVGGLLARAFVVPCP